MAAGAGAPKKTGNSRTKSVTVRMDIEINKALDEMSANTRISKSATVNAALSYFISMTIEEQMNVIQAYLMPTGGFGDTPADKQPGPGPEAKPPATKPGNGDKKH